MAVSQRNPQILAKLTRSQPLSEKRKEGVFR